MKKLGTDLARHIGQEEGGGHLPPLEQDGHPTPAGQCFSTESRAGSRLENRLENRPESRQRQKKLAKQTLSFESRRKKVEKHPPPTRFILTYPTHCNNKYLCYNVSLSL